MTADCEAMMDEFEQLSSREKQALADYCLEWASSQALYREFTYRRDSWWN